MSGFSVVPQHAQQHGNEFQMQIDNLQPKVAELSNSVARLGSALPGEIGAMCTETLRSGVDKYHHLLRNLGDTAAGMRGLASHADVDSAAANETERLA